MEITQLTGNQLQALRKVLFLDVREAAYHIGIVSVRTWQHWEEGVKPVPRDVSEKMRKAHRTRKLLIEKLETQDSLKYYHAFSEFAAENINKTELDWRIWQSAITALYLREQIAFK